MRYTHGSVIVLLLLVVTNLTSAQGDKGEKKNIKPSHKFGAIIMDKEKQKAAPATGYITNEKDFNELRSAWGIAADKFPKLDFQKQIVFVQLASGPNGIGSTYTLDANGDLTVKLIQTLRAGPGFGYGIDVLERDGIKSYRGKKIE
jgi:hypothetical protein